MATIQTLSNELLDLIFEHVYDDHTWDSNGSLALVNKHFNSLAFHSFTYRDLLIKRGHDHELFHEWITNPEKTYILGSVRTISITSDTTSTLYNSVATDETISEEEKESRIWKPIADLITNLRYLKCLRYVIPQPCPQILIDALQKHHPYAHLEVYRWGSYGERRYPNPDPQTYVQSFTLAKSPCLRTIETDFNYNRDDKFDFREAAFYHLLALAPDLTTVHLGYGTEDCTNNRPLEPEDKDEFRRLAEPFAVDDPVRKAIKKIELKGHKLRLSSRWIEQWSTWTDLSKLEGLTQYGEMDADFFTTATVNNIFGSLKRLALDLYTIRGFNIAVGSAVNDFLLRCRPLESLTLTNRRDSVQLSTILSRHGKSLRALHLHEREASRRPDRYNNFLASPRIVFSASDIKQIRDACPHLEELTVDIDRTTSTSTEREIYALLATFPNLAEITINFDLGLPYVQRRRPRERDNHANMEVFLPPNFGPKYPSLSNDSVTNIWSSIATAKVGVRLRVLHVNTGEKPSHFQPRFRTWWQEYEHDHHQEFTARASSRDDGEGRVEVLEMARDAQA